MRERTNHAQCKVRVGTHRLQKQRRERPNKEYWENQKRRSPGEKGRVLFGKKLGKIEGTKPWGETFLLGEVNTGTL